MSNCTIVVRDSASFELPVGKTNLGANPDEPKSAKNGAIRFSSVIVPLPKGAFQSNCKIGENLDGRWCIHVVNSLDDQVNCYIEHMFTVDAVPCQLLIAFLFCISVMSVLTGSHKSGTTSETMRQRLTRKNLELDNIGPPMDYFCSETSISGEIKSYRNKIHSYSTKQTVNFASRHEYCGVTVYVVETSSGSTLYSCHARTWRCFAEQHLLIVLPRISSNRSLRFCP